MNRVIYNKMIHLIYNKKPVNTKVFIINGSLNIFIAGIKILNFKLMQFGNKIPGFQKQFKAVNVGRVQNYSYRCNDGDITVDIYFFNSKSALEMGISFRTDIISLYS